MKFPNMDDVLACATPGCANALAGVLPAEAYALVRAGDETQVQAICPDCATEALAHGIPVEKITDLVERSEASEALAAAEKLQLEKWDARGQAFDSLFAGALYACRVPGCTSGPELVAKMSAVTRKGDGDKEVVEPICSDHAEKARSEGAEVRSLPAALANSARLARNQLLFVQAEGRKAIVQAFFRGCKQADRRGAAVATRPAHAEGSGFTNGARVAR